MHVNVCTCTIRVWNDSRLKAQGKKYSDIFKSKSPHYRATVCTCIHTIIMHVMYIHIGYTMKRRFIWRFNITEETCTIGVPSARASIQVSKLWVCWVAFAALSGSIVALFVSDMYTTKRRHSQSSHSSMFCVYSSLKLHKLTKRVSSQALPPDGAGKVS